MIQPARRNLSVDDFHAWVATQERKYELVDGAPLMMAGASRRHDRIARNTLVALDRRLRGHRCQPFTSDTFVRIPAGNVRLPDLGVDCGTFDDDSLETDSPILVVEILSPTTRTFDRTDKLEEYKTIDGLEYILLIDPVSPQVRLYWRDGARRWTSTRMVGLDAVVDMPVLGLHLPMSEVYRDLQFPPRPTLVEGDAVKGAL